MSLTLDCAKIQQIKATAESVWMDSHVNDELIAHVDAITALQANETAKLDPLADPKKDNTMKIYWPAVCDTGTVNETCEANACNPQGPKPQSNCQDVELDICGSYGFEIEERDFSDSLFSEEEMIARMEILTMNKLDQWWVRKYLAKIELFVGENQYTGNIGTVSGTTTEIPAAFWGASLVPYFGMVAERNMMNNHIILSGENLWFAKQEIPAMGANANGAGAAKLFSELKFFNDIWNVDQAHAGKATWVIGRGATKMVTRAQYSETPITYGNGANITRWKVQSRNIPGLWYDVDYKTECDGKKIKHAWNYSTEGGIFLNPQGCNDDITGVLLFECV